MALDDATTAVIRRLYFVDRWTLEAIADDLGVSLDAARCAIVLPGEQPDVAPRSTVPATVTRACHFDDIFAATPEEDDL